MKKSRNLTFSILSFLGIVLVMMGHLNIGWLDFVGIFPYYSFHVLIFVFVSGYFYNPNDEKHVFKYIWRKFLRLMVPYYIWNIVYGLIAMMLRRGGFEIGEEFNLWNVFVAPIIGGHQFMYNAPAWFVPALFLLEVCNILARKILSIVRIRNEYFLFVLYLVLGIATVYLAKRGSVYDYYKIPGRLLIMTPIFGLGRLYNDRLEEKESRLPFYVVIPCLFIVNVLLTRWQGGLGYSVVWVTGFAGSVVTPFITAITGIWLWLWISRILGKLTGFMSGIWNYLGAHTFSIMMHHLTMFMIVKAVFCVLGRRIEMFSDFQVENFVSDIYYTYLPNGNAVWCILYLAAGIAGSLLIGELTKKLTVRMSKIKIRD